MSKSPDAFRTISEVADELDLPQHVLRFWETRFGQIKPMKRGGGRRYYRPDDVELLRGIRILLYGEGYTIRGVQRILKEQGPRFVIAAGRGEFAGVPDARDRAAADAGPEEEEVYAVEDDEEEIDSSAPEVIPAAPVRPAPRPQAAPAAAAPRTPPFVMQAQPVPAARPPQATAPQASAPQVRPAAPAAAARPGLSAADADQLRATLAELLECKRVLDQVR